MKRMIFEMSVTAIALSSAWGDGTVRIYTGNGTWRYKDCNDLAVDCPGTPSVVAVNVVQNDGIPPENPWDRVFGSGGPPRPWEKLYEQSPRADGFWIGMRNDGRDIVEPNYGLDDSGNQLPSGNYIIRAATSTETALVGAIMVK